MLPNSLPKVNTSGSCWEKSQLIMTLQPTSLLCKFLVVKFKLIYIIYFTNTHVTHGQKN